MLKHFKNEKKGHVIAVIENCQYDAIRLVRKWSGYIVIPLEVECKMLMPNKITAIAKCDPRDTFNYDVGRNIADERVMKKYQKQVRRAIKVWLDYQKNIVNNVENILESKFSE